MSDPSVRSLLGEEFEDDEAPPTDRAVRWVRLSGGSFAAPIPIELSEPYPFGDGSLPSDITLQEATLAVQLVRTIGVDICRSLAERIAPTV